MSLVLVQDGLERPDVDLDRLEALGQVQGVRGRLKYVIDLVEGEDCLAPAFPGLNLASDYC